MMPFRWLYWCILLWIIYDKILVTCMECKDSRCKVALLGTWYLDPPGITLGYNCGWPRHETRQGHLHCASEGDPRSCVQGAVNRKCPLAAEWVIMRSRPLLRLPPDCFKSCGLWGRLIQTLGRSWSKSLLTQFVYTPSGDQLWLIFKWLIWPIGEDQGQYHQN